MQIKLKREVDRPFPDKRILRVVERNQGKIVHAWLVKMTDNGGVTSAEYHLDDQKPEWLRDLIGDNHIMDNSMHHSSDIWSSDSSRSDNSATSRLS